MRASSHKGPSVWARKIMGLPSSRNFHHFLQFSRIAFLHVPPSSIFSGSCSSQKFVITFYFVSQMCKNVALFLKRITSLFVPDFKKNVHTPWIWQYVDGREHTPPPQTFYLSWQICHSQATLHFCRLFSQLLKCHKCNGFKKSLFCGIKGQSKWVFSIMVEEQGLLSS